MIIKETQLRRAIRQIILEAEEDGSLEMTDAEKAAKAATIPKPATPPTPEAQKEEDLTPEQAFTRALAQKMRKKGVPESTVTAMLDATKGSP